MPAPVFSLLNEHAKMPKTLHIFKRFSTRSSSSSLHVLLPQLLTISSLSYLSVERGSSPDHFRLACAPRAYSSLRFTTQTSHFRPGLQTYKLLSSVIDYVSYVDQLLEDVEVCISIS